MKIRDKGDGSNQHFEKFRTRKLDVWLLFLNYCLNIFQNYIIRCMVKFCTVRFWIGCIYLIWQCMNNFNESCIMLLQKNWYSTFIEKSIWFCANCSTLGRSIWSFLKWCLQACLCAASRVILDSSIFALLIGANHMNLPIFPGTILVRIIRYDPDRLSPSPIWIVPEKCCWSHISRCRTMIKL